MASSFSDLGIELMATGENAGTWGTKTNTNLQIVEKAIAGYVEKSIAGGAQTTTLSITDGDTTESTSVARHAVIKLTGTITGNQVVTVPDSIEKVYIVTNGTSGAYTVQFKTASGTGVTFGVSEKTTKLFYSDGTNIVDAGFSGGTDLDGKELILDADADTSITADTDDQIDIRIAGADDFQFTANTFTAQSGSSVVIPDGGLTLGSTAVTSTAAELNLLDGVSGLVQSDLTKLAAVDSTAAELNIVDGDTSATSTTVADADRVVLNDNGTMVQVAVTDLAAYFDDEITAMPNLTSVGTLTTLTVDNIIINGTNIGHTSDTDAIAIASNGNVTVSQNLTVTGDLTVSGDDITMGTNTSGNILVADGTNFNSVAVGDLSEISTVANDDVFLAIDTSGGGLKKIARSAVVSGLASSAAISNVVEDTTPQLGGDLDVNSNGLVSTSNGNIALTPNGTGVVRVDGSNGIDMESGAISIKNSGAESYVRFYCESSNAHYTQLQAAPHSAYSGNVTVVLPASADTLVGRATTDTLTNKTLTTPVIAEIDSGSTITLDATTDIVLDADGANITMKDGGTTVLDFVLNGATDVTLDAPGDIKFDADGGDFNFLDGGTEILRISNSSSDVIIKPIVDAKDLIFQQRDGTEVARIEDNGTFNVVTDKLAINGTAVTSTAAELNILDGVTATATEINLIDGGTSAGTTAVADADGIITNDGGTMRLTTAATFKTYFQEGISTAFDDLTTGDAAVNVATTAGNITIDAQGSDTDIIFKGTDDSSDITALTLDMSAAGEATFNAGIVIADAGNIGSASDKDAIAIASNGVVTFSQAPVFPDGSIAVADLDIDGATDINADLVDADLFIVDDGAGGTNRKVAASRIKTYIGGGTQWQSVKTGNYTASAGQGVFANTTSSAFTVTLPASPSLGDEVTIVDYAGTFDSNALTVGRNSEKILGADEDLTVSTERASFTLVFTDSTQGWLFKND